MSLLVATDLSTRSVAAIRFGEELAAARGTQLTIIHVAPNTRPGIVPDAQNALELFLRDNAARPEDHTTDVVVGETLAVLAQSAMQHSIVICGATGNSYLDDIFLGSTASRLIRESPSPVCVIPDGHNPRFERIIVAMGFDEASRAALNIADELVEQTGAELHLLAAVQNGDQAEAQRQLDALAATRQGVTTHVVVAEPSAAIREAVADIDADIVVMGTHGRQEQSLYFLGSVAERVVRQPPCPIITVRPYDD